MISASVNRDRFIAGLPSRTRILSKPGPNPRAHVRSSFSADQSRRDVQGTGHWGFDCAVELETW